MIPISVVMPVYNTPPDYLRCSTESILGQTLKDFEFIIVDDCSDRAETCTYLANLSDERVQVIRNPENYGITISLNIGFRAASGKYIARMDSDDISLPDRFEKQYGFMEKNPGVILCGSYAESFGDKTGIRKPDISDQENYRIKLFFTNAGPPHPTAFFRRDMLVQHNIEYDERLRYAQDYMMWIKCSEVADVKCLAEIMLQYRWHAGQVSSSDHENHKISGNIIRKEQLYRLLDHVTDKDATNHKNYFHEEKITDASYSWFMNLIQANDEKAVYNKEKFRTFVTNLIAQKVYATYDIHWKDPRSYRILLKYLPVSYIINEVRKKAANKLGYNQQA